MFQIQALVGERERERERERDYYSSELLDYVSVFEIAKRNILNNILTIVGSFIK